LTFKLGKIHHSTAGYGIELTAQAFLEMRMSTRESSGVDDMQGGMRPRGLHEELLRLPAVIRRVGLRKTAIYEKIRRAEFPKPVAIGVRARAWRASDINTWIAERAAPELLAE
jgi:prophage regulatory protein